MLNNFVKKIFPCEKMIVSLLDRHENAKTSAMDASDRLIRACDSTNGKLCIVAPYSGQDRRKAE